MCGIVGYIGGRDVEKVLLGGLSKLEYRGYDSAGIAVLGQDGLKVVKCRGRLANLAARLENERTWSSEPFLGIGHTRWATHGEPNDVNSHPHLSHSGKIAVVHNGIIENYMKLKDFLILKGFCFISDTDTEVVAHLLDYYFKGDLVEAVRETVRELEGSYAIGVISLQCPDLFVAARKDSPLIVGAGSGENFIASDIPAILEYTRDIYILEDREIAVIDRNRVRIFNVHGEEVERKIFHVTWNVDAAEKGGFAHFMMKEMCEEPKALRDTISPRVRDGNIVLDDIKISDEDFASIEKIFIIACGTAYHAGVVAKYAIEKLARIPVETDLASEFRYRNPIIDKRHLVIIISQSGETIDTLFALREAKKRGARVLSVVNVVGSSIARESNDVLYTWAGPEIAVASTKAYNTQLVALYLIAINFAARRATITPDEATALVARLCELPAAVDRVLGDREAIQRFAALHYNARSVFFIGRGLDYALAMEGSLKLKEISYIHSEAYAGGELKHGTIALIEDGTLVICPMTQDALFDKMVSNIKEVKARGAVVMAIVPEKNAKEAAKSADVVITIPDIDPLFAPALAVTPMQLFAYYVAVQKGCDVDKPRNLAKSVTVE